MTASRPKKVYEFRTMLENKMRSTGMKGVDVVWQDERLTTVMAEKVLIEADVSRKKRKEVIDKQAAVLIMQGYLDTLSMKKRLMTNNYIRILEYNS